MSSVAKDAFTSVLSDPENVDANRAIKKLKMKAVGQRDMNIQEGALLNHETPKQLFFPTFFFLEHQNTLS